MTAPTYNNSARYNSATFQSSLSGNFDVGTGTNIGVLCMAMTNNNGQNITGVTINGISMTAETSVELGPFSDTGEYRMFSLAGQSFTGSQAFVVSADNTNGSLDAVFYAVKDCTAVATISNGSGSFPGYTVTQTVSSDTNSLVAAIWQLFHSGTVAADSPTVERMESASAYHSVCYIPEEAGASSTTVSVTVTGGSTPGYYGAIFSLTGTIAAGTPGASATTYNSFARNF